MKWAVICVLIAISLLAILPSTVTGAPELRANADESASGLLEKLERTKRRAGKLNLAPNHVPRSIRDGSVMHAWCEH